MDEFFESDFGAISDFALGRRWTTASHDLLPPAVLATIRPLTVEAAERVAQVEPTLPSDTDPAVRSWEAGDVPEAVTRAWLATLPVPSVETVVVTWSPQIAVVTEWRTFVEHWDAFCYPSSDDVTVWSSDRAWCFCYRHFEQMLFWHPPRDR